MSQTILLQQALMADDLHQVLTTMEDYKKREEKSIEASWARYGCKPPAGPTVLNNHTHRFFVDAVRPIVSLLHPGEVWDYVIHTLFPASVCDYNEPLFSIFTLLLKCGQVWMLEHAMLHGSDTLHQYEWFLTSLSKSCIYENAPTYLTWAITWRQGIANTSPLWTRSWKDLLSSARTHSLACFKILRSHIFVDFISVVEFGKQWEDASFAMSCWLNQASLEETEEALMYTVTR